MDDELRIDFYDENGDLKSKEDILEELAGVYDQISEEVDYEPRFADLFLSEEVGFSPTNVIDKFQFIHRNIWINTEIVPALGRMVIERIQYWNTEDAFDETPVEERIPIRIYIDSPGGDLTTTMAIVDAIQNSKTPVYTIVTGTAYSGGFFITLAGHKRYGYKNSTYLFHEGSANFGGDAHKLRQQTEFYRKILLKQIKKLVLNTTGIDEDLYKEHCKDDWYLDANKALQLKVIDEIANDVIGGFDEDEE